MPFYTHDLTCQDLLDFMDAHPQKTLILYSPHNIANAEMLVRDGILREIPTTNLEWCKSARTFTYVEK